MNYVHGDMRDLPWTGEFDVVLSWFTSFGYFPDEENHRVLQEASRALRPGGLFAIELMHPFGLIGRFQSSIVRERDGNLLVDRCRLDPTTSRMHTERTIVRDGQVRHTRFYVRLFGFPEIREWLLAAGFDAVAAYGPQGETLTAEHTRMIVLAARGPSKQ